MLGNSGKLDFHIVITKQELDEIKLSVKNAEVKFEASNERLNGYYQKFAGFALSIIIRIDEDLKEVESPVYEGKMLADLIREPVKEFQKEQEVNLILAKELDGLTRNGNVLVTRYNMLNAAKHYLYDEDYIEELISMTPLPKGLNSNEKKLNVNKFMEFFRENKEDLPSYMQDYIQAWLSENKR